MLRIEAALRMMRLVFLSAIASAAYFSFVTKREGLEGSLLQLLFFVFLAATVISELADMGRFLGKLKRQGRPAKNKLGTSPLQ